MTPSELAAIEARLRAAHVPGSGKMREFLENSPADIAALLAEVSRLKVELQASHDNFTRMVELNKEEQKLRDSAQEISAMAELNLRDLVHVNEVIALQRAVDGRGETIDALEDELTPLRAQLEAVTTERDRYKAALERIAENGTHHDLTPTKKMWGADRKPLDEANEIWWHAWIKRMDEQVKTIAREALKGAGQ